MFQKLLGLMAAASSVVPLGLLHIQSLQHWRAHVPSQVWCEGHLILRVNHGFAKSLVPWKWSHLYHLGVELGLVSRRNMVSWAEPMTNWHINCLVMMAVLLDFNEFQSELKGHRVLVRQHVSGSLYKLQGGSQVSSAKHVGRGGQSTQLYYLSKSTDTPSKILLKYK